jgi:hypothetical protein
LSQPYDRPRARTVIAAEPPAVTLERADRCKPVSSGREQLWKDSRPNGVVDPRPAAIARQPREGLVPIPGSEDGHKPATGCSVPVRSRAKTRLECYGLPRAAVADPEHHLAGVSAAI